MCRFCDQQLTHPDPSVRTAFRRELDAWDRGENPVTSPARGEAITFSAAPDPSHLSEARKAELRRILDECGGDEDPRPNHAPSPAAPLGLTEARKAELRRLALDGDL